MINSIHFGGGAFGVLGYIGVLNFMENNISNFNILDLSGTSAGAIFAFLILLGIKSNEMIELFTPDILKDIVQINSIIEYESNGNLLNYSNLWKKLSDICDKKNFNFETLSFDELYKQTNRKFTITGTCVQSSKGEIFSYITHADMKIKKALEITTCIPFLLRPVEYNNNFYVDGALSDFFFFKDNDLIVGNNTDFNKDFLKNNTGDIIDYIINLINALVSIVTNIRYKSEKCVLITSDGFLPFFNNNTIFKSVLEGYDKTQLYFKKHI